MTRLFLIAAVLMAFGPVALLLALGTLLTIGLFAEPQHGSSLLEAMPLLVILSGGYVGLLGVANLTAYLSGMPISSRGLLLSRCAILVGIATVVAAHFYLPKALENALVYDGLPILAGILLLGLSFRTSNGGRLI